MPSRALKAAPTKQPAPTKTIREAQAKVVELPRTYTKEQFGEVFQLSRRTVDRLLLTGRVKSVTIGRRRLVPAAEVDRLLREGVAS